eukprot:TRINITY_DN19255_c0_g1_i1.p1 TRINITY_DN19255_c0_g1~~TRINITY_DN19255_c0_g1_i1.p1  ORF type:complete len:300 (-),score=44.81 TRINITY_DN19255_c0_g1_i1:66-965(-)
MGQAAGGVERLLEGHTLRGGDAARVGPWMERVTPPRPHPLHAAYVLPKGVPHPLPPAPSSIFDHLRVESKFSFDTRKYRFYEMVCAMLEVSSLEDIHLQELGQNVRHAEEILGRALTSGRTTISRKWKSSPLQGDFQKLYRKFVQEIVAPMIGDTKLVYQTTPTFRCQLPRADKNLGPMHRDGDYYHQPNEINIWLPLVPVDGSNSLWAESRPQQGDFHPFVLQYGEAARFWGNRCWHYTVRNTSNITRFSFDFRVVPFSIFDADWDSRFAGRSRFQLSDDGGASHYSICTTPSPMLPL